MTILQSLILLSALLLLPACGPCPNESSSSDSSNTDSTAAIAPEPAPEPPAAPVETTIAAQTESGPAPGAEPTRRNALEQALTNISANARAAWSSAMDALPARPDIHPGISLYDTTGERATWRAPGGGETLGPRVVLLVHGLDEPGGIWDNVAPAVAEAGYSVARFDYPNDQAIADSSVLLFESLADLRARGVTRVDLICHSMGGLVARQALTAPDHYNGLALGTPTHPRVERLITVGTPHYGSPWARLRGVAEMREQAVRWFNGSNHTADDLLRFAADGQGQAGHDLLPTSAFLTDLNARPNPGGVDITCIVGLAAPVKDENLDAVFDSTCLAELLGQSDADRMRGAIESLRAQVGDGVVTAKSATLEGTEPIMLKAHHRSLLRRNGKTPPPAIAVILEKLEAEEPEPYLAP